MSRIAFAALSLLALHTVAAPAQSVDTTTVVQQGELRPLVPRPKIFDRRDAWIATGFTLGALALFPLDQQIAGQLQSPATQSNRSFDKTATTLEKITSPGAYLIGGGMYLAGRLGGSPRLADLALHTTESVVLAEVWR